MGTEQARKDRRKRAKRRREGLCTRCGQPSSNGIMCAKCRRYARLYKRRRQNGRAWTPGGPGRPPASHYCEAQPDPLQDAIPEEKTGS